MQLHSWAIAENINSLYILTMNNIKNFYFKYRLAIGIITFIAMIIFVLAIFNHHKNTYITAEFKDLRPFRHKIEVYYKGFKIGHAYNVRPSKDYQTTIMTIVLHPLDLKLPVNTVAKLKREKKGRHEVDFIDLIYPEAPSIYYLKSGDKISGKATVDLNSFLATQDPESLEAIKADLAKSAENLNLTLSALADLFGVLKSIVEENRQNLLDTTDNMKNTTLNLERLSEKVDSSIDKNKLTNTFDNVDTSSSSIRTTLENTQQLTGDLEKITSNVDQMLPKIDCILDEAYSIMKNTDDITCIISNPMNKPSAGMPIFFGKSGANSKRCYKKI